MCVCGRVCVCVRVRVRARARVCVCAGSQRLLGRAMEFDRKLRRRVLEVVQKLEITDFDAQLPALLQVLPEPNVRVAPIVQRVACLHRSCIWLSGS